MPAFATTTVEIATRGRGLMEITGAVRRWLESTGCRDGLLPTQLSIPLHEGRLVLGTWQGIFLYEHRSAAHRRRVVLQLMGTDPSDASLR